MFSSGVLLGSLIDEVVGEVDIASNIPQASYIRWANSLLIVLYTDIIREMATADMVAVSPTGLVGFNFEDIVYVRLDGVELSHGSPIGIMRNVYYKLFNELAFVGDTGVLEGDLSIVYMVKPPIIDITDDVPLPYEFLELLKAKLRAEAYKIVNENVLAGNWIADFNAQLEVFKVWIANRLHDFGV